MNHAVIYMFLNGKTYDKGSLGWIPDSDGVAVSQGSQTRVNKGHR